MPVLSLPIIAAWSVALAFAVSAAAHLAGLRRLRAAYAEWEYPHSFHRVVGVSNLVAALFLAIPETRVWGVALAAVILFIAVVTLLNHRRYYYAVPGMLLMLALPPALLATGA
jgi:hypothetical protein